MKGASMHSPVCVLLPGCREAALAGAHWRRPRVGAGAGLGALMWWHTLFYCGEL